jgi:uncharacterized membrane protein YGL010W
VAVAALLILLTVLCNLTLLAAMAAGRALRGWRQRVWMGAQAALLTVALAVAILIAVATGTTDKTVGALLTLLGLAFTLAIAGILVYVEYVLAGRRAAFGDDLKGSLWVGRSGVRRLDGR